MGTVAARVTRSRRAARLPSGVTIPTARRSLRRSDKNTLAMTVSVAGVLAGIFVGIFARTLLGGQYFRDDQTLRQFMRSTPPGLVSSPFGRTAHFYNILGLSDHNIIRGTLAAVMIALIVARCWPQTPDLWAATVTFGGIVLSGIYLLPTYSKEFFVLPLVLAFAFLGESRKWEVAWLGLVLVYGNELRANWIAVLLVYLGIRLLLVKVSSIQLLLVMLGVGVFILSLYFEVRNGVSLHHYRYVVTGGGDSAAVSGSANTVIIDPLPGGNLFGDWVNGVYSAVTFLLPFPLILLKKPFYLGAGLFLGVTWWLVLRKARSMFAAPRLPADVRLWRTLSLVFAYTFVQSLYAPDWGAYFRHITPLMPLFAWFLSAPTAVETRRPARQSVTLT